MGDFSDDYGGYDVLGLYEQRDDDRRAQRAKLLTPYAPPKYAIKTHWEKDGRIGVVVAIVRPDGGVHLLQDFVDPPKTQEKYTYGTPLLDAMTGKGTT
jgi:hypothetical protein